MQSFTFVSVSNIFVSSQQNLKNPKKSSKRREQKREQKDDTRHFTRACARSLAHIKAQNDNIANPLKREKSDSVFVKRRVYVLYLF